MWVGLHIIKQQVCQGFSFVNIEPRDQLLLYVVGGIIIMIIIIGFVSEPPFCRLPVLFIVLLGF